ncbi:hypothetical protein B0T18DRAFT_430033 [Schizothecium vesticola]|uniref:MARVEL domain-containing protein n=1 Tax=Schizothecium vesticola TaxID=314040 RepID=A0AA40ENH8_9PEZI|nr:hypothetical protein B0T18DRAFT_430033 [Schizothecium vesticola]
MAGPRNHNNTLTNVIPRTLLGLSNLIVLASSAILTGILSHFFHKHHGRGTHLIYNEVIAVLTLFFYLFAVVLPIIKSYRGHLLPLNLILSYLWLTSLIFTSQDWAGGRCRYNTFNMGLSTHCGLKHTAMAFFIIGFSTLFLNTIIEAYMWAFSRQHTTVVNEKAAMAPKTTNGVGATV